MAQDLLAGLQARNLLQQCSGAEQLQALLNRGPQVVYAGYDPTGDSLHVGHLVTLMALRHLHDAGHEIILLMGGGTALVGDPTGKTQMRPMLAPEAIAHNAGRILQQARRILGAADGTFEAAGAVRVRTCNNADWLAPLGYLTFLREVGRHFSVNRMLAAEAYKSRLQTGLSFLEFNYQLLQAYDFLQLARSHGCRLQLGGDDQWSNMLAGTELCRRSAQLQTFALTVPLLTTSSGQKMGKTAAGAVWLDADKLHPNDFFQYWVNVDDRDTTRFLRIYTQLPCHEIASAAAFDQNAQKRVLAYEVTALVHGAQAATDALRAAAAAFGAVALPAALLPSSAVPRALDVSPSDAVHHSLACVLGPGPWLLAAVLKGLGWAKTSNDARRLMAQGAVKVDEETIADVHYQIDHARVAAAKISLRAGKKKRAWLLP